VNGSKWSSRKLAVAVVGAIYFAAIGQPEVVKWILLVYLGAQGVADSK
jgi:hypothetical protein